MARAQFNIVDFDADGDFVVSRANLLLGGEKLPLGSTFPKAMVSARRLRQLYEARHIGRPPGFVEKPPTPRRKLDYDAITRSAFEASQAREKREREENKRPNLGAFVDRVAPAIAEEPVVAAADPAVAQQPVEENAKPALAPTVGQQPYSAEDMGLAAEEAAPLDVEVPTGKAHLHGPGAAAAKGRSAKRKSKKKK